ncbi:DUF3775 domain-containing protein [Porticoccus sp.]
MLNVNPETVCRLINLARGFQAQEDVTFPEEQENASGDWAIQLLASHPDDSTFLEFKSIIDDLEPDQQWEVVALQWLGRGDFTKDEWTEAVAEATNSWNARTAEYLIAHPLLPDDLQEGLDILGYSCD